MLVSRDGRVQPAICSAPHWAMFTAFMQHPDLCESLRSRVTQGVEAVINAQPNVATIESPRLGTQVLADIGSWWHGEFPRRFPNFPNGAARGIFGMVLWNYLAQRSDWWCFVEQQDSHGYGENAMRYWQLKPGSSLIPNTE